jgi:hypothetical protein
MTSWAAVSFEDRLFSMDKITCYEGCGETEVRMVSWRSGEKLFWIFLVAIQKFVWIGPVGYLGCHVQARPETHWANTFYYVHLPISGCGDKHADSIYYQILVL